MHIACARLDRTAQDVVHGTHGRRISGSVALEVQLVFAERAAGSLVAELPRVPGTRETRWTQLLTGAPPAADPPASAPRAPDASDVGRGLSHLAAELDALRAEVAALRSAVAELQAGKSGN